MCINYWFVYCLPYKDRDWLFDDYLRCLTQWLAHRRHLINICWLTVYWKTLVNLFPSSGPPFAQLSPWQPARSRWKPLCLAATHSSCFAQVFCLHSSTVAWNSGEVHPTGACPFSETQWTVLRFTPHCSSAGAARSNPRCAHDGDQFHVTPSVPASLTSYSTLLGPYSCCLG